MFAPNYLPATRYGGPVQSAHGLARALVRHGHEVEIFTTDVDGPGRMAVPLCTPVLQDGIPVRYFPLAWPRRIYRSPSMQSTASAEMGRFDVVHVNGMFLWPGPVIARSAERHGVPLVISPRGMLMPAMIEGRSTLVKRAWISTLERRNLASARCIHVTSQEEADGLRSSGLDLAPIAIVGNGVDLPEPAPSADEIEGIWAGIPPGSRVAFLARLDWTKGVDMAIHAARSHPTAMLLVAGHDQVGLRATLEPHLTRPDGTIAARFVGPLEGRAKWALLAGADVLLAPSVKESFGTSVAEAMAIGTPVVCTAGVGAGVLVRQVDAGLVVEREQRQLNRVLAEVLGSPERRTTFGGRSRRLMTEGHTWSSVADRMLRVYAGHHFRPGTAS